MEKLRELAGIITRNKIKSLRTIDANTKESTKLMQFYQALQDDPSIDDERAFALLYDGSGSRNAYYKLKHTLHKRLLNTILFIDIKQNDDDYDFAQALNFCQRSLIMFKQLTDRGAYKNALEIAKKGLERALAYGQSEEAIFIARRLRNYYSFQVGDIKQFEYYDTLIKDLQELNQACNQVESYHCRLLVEFINERSYKHEVRELAAQYVKAISDLKPNRPSSFFYSSFTMIRIIYHFSGGEYAEVEKVASEGLRYLRELPYTNKRAQMAIALQYIASCILLKHFEDGEREILNSISLTQSDRHNWYKLMELYVMLCLHTKRYEKAQEIFHEVYAQPNFKKQLSNVREAWHVLNAYLYLLRQANLLEESPNHRKVNFHLGKFLNQVPVYTKDKRGVNAAILTAQYLVTLLKGSHDQLIDRSEAFNKYRQRYLQREDAQRLEHFWRMLLEIPRANFEAKLVEVRARKHREQLEAMPASSSLQLIGIEIIPFEDLWEIVMNKLV